MGAKQVLIITYYWPPGGGAGVQRWLKFVKYLPQHSWNPIIYTPENGEMPVIDESLLQDVPEGVEVLKTKIWEPYSLYKKFVGAGKNEKINTGFLSEKARPDLTEKLSVWLRGNFFIPDARCFWIKPSVRYLSKWLQENKVDAIVSTGPPHSMHLIAMPLAKKFSIPWIADFRDPWTNIDYYNDLMLTNKSDAKHHQLEHQVVTSASRVVVVSGEMVKEFESKYNRKIDLITNGYDEDDINTNVSQSSSKFVIAHVGTLVRSRNPEALWKAIAGVLTMDESLKNNLEIRLAGKVDVSVRQALEKFGLIKFVTYIDYLPHNQVATEQQSASLLLLILNNSQNSKGILTGKLFEYLAAQRPILGVGPVDGNAAEIIRETESGEVFDFYDEEGIKKYVSESYGKFKAGSLNRLNSSIEKYSRRKLTGKLVEILNNVISSD